ncbi:MAG: sigma-70 family RNA polymerase sigma factor [Bacilli bacterium]
MSDKKKTVPAVEESDKEFDNLYFEDVSDVANEDNEENENEEENDENEEESFDEDLQSHRDIKNNALGSEYQLFMSQLNNRPKIDLDENKAKLAAYKRSPSLVKRNEIVEDNLRLVIPYATYYSKITSSKGKSNVMDLIQEGSMGLMNAVEDFDPSLGFAFSSFAVPYIQNAIRHYLSVNDQVIHIPPNVQTKIRKYKTAVRELTGKLSRAPTDDEVLSHMGGSFTDKDLVDIRTYSNSVYSLDRLTSDDNGDDSGRNLLATLYDPEDDPSAYARKKEQRQLLSKALMDLDDRSRNIFLKRQNAGSKTPTLSEVGKEYGITPERVRQIESEALNKIKAYVTKNDS